MLWRTHAGLPCFTCDSGHRGTSLPRGLQSIVLRGGVDGYIALRRGVKRSRFGWSQSIVDVLSRSAHHLSPHIYVSAFASPPTPTTKESVLRDLSHRAQSVDLYGVRAHRLWPLHGGARQSTLPPLRPYLQVGRIRVLYFCFKFASYFSHEALVSLFSSILEMYVWIYGCISVVGIVWWTLSPRSVRVPIVSASSSRSSALFYNGQL